VSDSLALQLCREANCTSKFTFGLIADATPGAAGLQKVRSAVGSWRNTTYLDGMGTMVKLDTVYSKMCKCFGTDVPIDLLTLLPIVRCRRLVDLPTTDCNATNNSTSYAELFRRN
jgi:hypothetical protein